MNHLIALTFSYEYIKFSLKYRFAVRLLRHKSCTMCQPIKLQIHLWTNRKRLSSVEYSSACWGSGAYTSQCTLHLSSMTDCRRLLTFFLRSKLCTVQVFNVFNNSYWSILLWYHYKQVCALMYWHHVLYTFIMKM
jgi:hypothetical protein